MNHLLFLDAPELIVIALVFLLLFGGKKIPELMKGIGQGMKEFKKASKYDPAEEESSETARREKF